MGHVSFPNKNESMAMGLLEFSEKIERGHTSIPTLTHGADRGILLLLAFEVIEGYSPDKLVCQFKWAQSIPPLVAYTDST